MATSKDNLTEYLECGICLEMFEEPKVLSCQHLYCKKCLERLVTGGVQGAYEIACPECRQKTKVPNGDVSGLASNYVINGLLLKRSDSKPSCKEHEGEILKLFCQSCDQLICGDCTLIDHRDHQYNFLKQIFPAEKEKIEEFLKKSKLNVLGLQTSIETLKEQQDGVKKNFLEVNKEIDSLIEKQIELLEQKRKAIKDELRKSVLTQINEIQSQMEYFASTLASAKTSVEVVERTLSKGSEVDVLSSKNEMIHQLTEIDSTTANLEARGKVSYVLKANPALDEKTVREMAKVREYDEDYKLTISPNVPPWLKRLVVNEQEALKSNGKFESIFYIRSRRKDSRFDPNNEVEVKIKSPGQIGVCSPSIRSHHDGSFTFSFDPNMSLGDYKIDITINERYMQGSPFTWEVR